MEPEYRKSQMLGVFHMITSITLLFAMFVPGWIGFIFGTVLTAPAETLRAVAEQRNSPATPQMVYGMAVVILTLSVLAALIMLGLAIATGLMARWVHKRQHFRFCLTVACLECLVLPHGTLFGILTVMFLSRPEVRAQFFEPEHDTDALGAYAPPLPAEPAAPAAPVPPGRPGE